jgi:uncharacterized protein YecT (DUF1311 family)
MKAQFVAFAFVLLAASPALAEVDCKKAMAQPDLNECAAREFSAADDELNAVWKDARAAARQIDTAEKTDYLKGAEKALVGAQRGWIAYRDGHCALAGFDMRGGQAEPMLVSGCLTEMTRKRTAELKEFAGKPR